jgi:hypothetical protein
MAMSHTNCKHAATSAGRRECRSLGGPAGWATANSAAINKPTGMPEPAEIGTDFVSRAIKMIGPVVRPRGLHTMAPAPSLIIRPDSSSCIQAALHIDAHGGRCACGWEAVA